MWVVKFDGDDVHLVPEGEEHVFTDCPCGPYNRPFENMAMTVHRELT